MDEQKTKQRAEAAAKKIKELAREGNASRVMILRNGEVLLNLSLNAGIVGAVVGLAAAPYVLLTAALVSFGMDCEIAIEKEDGTIWCLRETEVGFALEEVKCTVKKKARDFFSKRNAKHTH